jgi:hypothetical protein
METCGIIRRHRNDALHPMQCAVGAVPLGELHSAGLVVFGDGSIAAPEIHVTINAASTFLAHGMGIVRGERDKTAALVCQRLEGAREHFSVLVAIEQQYEILDELLGPLDCTLHHAFEMTVIAAYHRRRVAGAAMQLPVMGIVLCMS